MTCYKIHTLVLAIFTNCRSAIGYVPLCSLKGAIITEEYAAIILYEDEDCETCETNEYYSSCFRPSFPNPYIEEIR